MSERIQTILLVSVITLLIWLYAEGEATGERTRHIQIQLIHDNDDVLIIEPDGPASANIRLHASAAQMSRIDDLLAQGPVELPLPEDLLNNHAGEVDLRQLLQSSEFARGVTLIEVSPERIPVRTQPAD